jgi:hypothetical protein
VTVIRGTNRCGVPAVLVRIEHAASETADDSELRIVVPNWMLDELACSKVVVRDTPQIELQALWRLRELADRLEASTGAGQPTGEEQDDSSSLRAKGDRHETRIATPATRQKVAAKATDA